MDGRRGADGAGEAEDREAGRGQDGPRVLYDINRDDYAGVDWEAFSAAIYAGTTLRRTQTHVLLDGSIELIAYDDPFAGNRRYAVITARDPGSDYRAVDYPEHAPAEAAYEESVHANRDDELPYRSSDMAEIKVDRRSKDPDGLRVLPSGIIVAVEDLEEYDRGYGLPLRTRWPTTPEPGVPRTAVCGMTAGIRDWGPADVAVREVTPAAWSAEDEELRPNSLALLSLLDGRQLLASAHDTSAHVWSVGDGRRVCTVSGHSEWVLSVALAVLPDGRAVLASGGKDGLARIWSLPEGAALQEIEAHRRPVNSLAWALPPGEVPWLVTGGDDATVRLWDVETARAVRTFQVGEPGLDLVWSVAAAVLSDGRVRVAAAVRGMDEDTVHLWDATTGTKEREFVVERSAGPGHPTAFPRVAVAALADGSFRVAAVAGPVVRVWDGHTGAVVRTLSVPAHGDGDIALAVLPGLRVAVAACGGRETTVWDTESGDVVTRVEHAVDGVPVAVDLAAGFDGGLLLATGRQNSHPARVRRLDVRW